jgi:hypothetical protein
MSAQKITINTIDPDGKWLYRVGGLSALALGIGYIVIMILYIPLGAPPNGAEARLTYLAGNTSAWWAILILSVLTDFLFVPLMFALYVALKGINRNLMLMATAFVGLFVVLDLALTWTNYASLITLSNDYVAATTDAQRAVIIAAATYPSLALEYIFLGVYIILIPAIGILITGIVMLEGNFSKSSAYVGLATGIFGTIGVVGPFFVNFLGIAIILASILTTIWALFVGYNSTDSVK